MMDDMTDTAEIPSQGVISLFKGYYSSQGHTPLFKEIYNHGDDPLLLLGVCFRLAARQKFNRHFDGR